MANFTGTGLVWNLPNYVGELYTSAMLETPFLSMIGGINGGQMTGNFEFATDSLYDHDDLEQKSITENQSLTAPDARTFVRGQSKNVTQIFHETVSISYVRQSNQQRLSGINTAGSQNNVVSEKDWQIAKTIEKIARQVEWHFLRGTYAIATNQNEPNQTRGILNNCGVDINANSAALSKELIDQLMLEMFTSGAQFRMPTLLCNGRNLQILSDIYGFPPDSRTVGGVDVRTLLTNFCTLNIAPAHRMMPTDTIAIVDLAVCDPVFQPVPDKGNFFYEELAKTGAAEEGMIFGQIGLAHGPDFLHGKIRGLAV